MPLLHYFWNHNHEHYLVKFEASLIVFDNDLSLIITINEL